MPEKTVSQQVREKRCKRNGHEMPKLYEAKLGDEDLCDYGGCRRTIGENDVPVYEYPDS